jgi:hypothetical protein
MNYRSGVVNITSIVSLILPELFMWIIDSDYDPHNMDAIPFQ